MAVSVENNLRASVSEGLTAIFNPLSFAAGALRSFQE